MVSQMLRSFLIYLSKAGWAQRVVTGWKFAWKMASRFVAGESLQDAILAIRELNQKGIVATLDQLGEHTTTSEEATQSTEGILKILDEIDQAGIQTNVSIKLTQIGMGLDDTLSCENLIRILHRAK
jgi:proline dehydrogenase